MDSFMLKLNVNFENNVDIKKFISQFQVHCKQLICLINNETIKYYTKREQLPNNTSYLYMKKNTVDEYYFKDLDTNDIYCVFGKLAANVFYPNISDIIDREGKIKHKPIMVTYSNIEPKYIIVYHQDKKIDIKWSNREVEIKESLIF